MVRSRKFVVFEQLLPPTGTKVPKGAVVHNVGAVNEDYTVVTYKGEEFTISNTKLRKLTVLDELIERIDDVS